MIKRIILILYLLILVLSININGTVMRNDVIQRASAYATYNWVVKTPNTRYLVYKYSGASITGVSYSYGNTHNIFSFQSAISGGKIPRNWMLTPGVPANPSGSYAGTDCAALVRDCWGANTQIIDIFVSNCLKIDGSKIKSGDIVARTGNNRHVQIAANQIFGYEAAGWGNSTDTLIIDKDHQRVRISPLHSAGDGFNPYSPFPQFSDEEPFDGEIVDGIVSCIDISVYIYGKGGFTTDNVSMFVNGIKIEKTNTEIIPKSDTSVQFIAHDSTLNSWSGEVNVEVTARNDILGNGFIDKYNWQFTINRDSTPPRVISTSPQYGAEDVPIDITPITITFSKPMDTTATENALMIDPPVNCSTYTYWENGKKLYLTLDYDTLDYCEEYTVTISDAAKDTFGIKLDGDGDGNAGGDCKFKFKTEDPNVSFKLNPNYKIFYLPGDSYMNGNIVTNGINLKKGIKDVNVTSNITGDSNALSFGGGNDSFNLNAGEIHNIPYSIHVFNEGYIYVNSALKYKDFTKDTQGTFIAVNTSTSTNNYPDPDHPDENQSPGMTNYPTEWIMESDSIDSDIKVGIFTSGLGMGFSHLLGKYNITSVPIFPDLKYWRNPDTTLSDVIDLLVIGSGALTEYNSPEFKQKLENYVSGGGNLLVLDQKRGLYYSVLPGNIEGYGWSEDQSCFQNAVYLNEWHPIFSGQTRQFIDCKVDGYLNQYPNNTNILLKRTTNGMPALISYPYGTGNITITSMYPDWGYGHNQVYIEELRLFRDLTTWAMNPYIAISEFYPDSNVSVPVKIYYSDYDTLLAEKAIMKVYNPDRELYDSLNMAINLNYGKDTEFIWNHSLLPESLGLWTIDYALLDSNDQYIQKYNRGATFSQRVDIPAGNYNLGDYQIWANSNTERVMTGDTVKFHVYLRNNTDSLFQGKIIIGTHNNISNWSVIDSITGISLPPDSIFEFSDIKILVKTSSIARAYFGFYKDSTSFYDMLFTNSITNCYKAFIVIPNPFSISIKTDTSIYLVKDTVHYSVRISNKLDYIFPINYKIYTKIKSIKYYTDSQDIILPQNGDTIINGSLFPFDFDSVGVGNCEIGCELSHNNGLYRVSSIHYSLIYPNVSISGLFPDSFDYNGLNPYNIKLTSEWDYIPPGILNISGKNYYDSLMIGYSQTPETILTFHYQPTQWHINDYIIAEYRYGNKISRIKKTLQFLLPIHYPVAIKAVLENNTFYPGDTAKFSGIFKGRGNLYGAPIKGWVLNCPPGSVDSLFDSTIINPGEMKTLNIQTYIDTSSPFGGPYIYGIGVKYLDYLYYEDVVPGYKIYPPEANLVWLYNDTFQIDEQIPVTFTNPIKTTSKVKLNYIQLSGNRAYNQETGPGEVEVPPESSYTYLSDIPQWTTGKYNLKINSEIVRGEGHLLDLYKNYGCPVFLEGIESGLSVNSNRDWYLNNDDITLNSDINNGNFAYTGVETLSVYPFEETTNVYSSILDYCSFYGVHTENDSLGVPISASIDSFYSLHAESRYYMNYYDPFILSDGTENIWLIDSYSATLYTPVFEDTLRYFVLDSIEHISDCVI